MKELEWREGDQDARGLRIGGCRTNLVTNFLPNDPGHLVSVELDDRVCDGDFLERLGHVVCMVRKEGRIGLRVVL
jgi:hypothetical protein